MAKGLKKDELSKAASLIGMGDVSVEEREALNSIFVAFDEANCGMLELEIFAKCLTTLQQTILDARGARVFPAGEISMLVDELRDRGETSVTFDRFYAIMRRKLLGLPPENCAIHAFLELFDRKRCGYVASYELRHILTTTGSNPLTSVEADEFISLADANENGLVHYPSLLKSMTKEIDKYS